MFEEERVECDCWNLMNIGIIGIIEATRRGLRHSEQRISQESEIVRV